MRKMLAAAIAAAFVPALAVFAADAKTNWADNCTMCHGEGGKGDTHMGAKLHVRDFTDAAVQARFTDDEAFKALKEGLKDGTGKVRMKPLEGLSDDEIKALVQYVRGLKS